MIIKMLKHAIISIIILTLSLLMMWYVKYENFNSIFDILHEYILLIIVWLASSTIFKKFRYQEQKHFGELIVKIIKSSIFTTGIIAILMFTFKEFSYSRLLVVGTIFLATILDAIFYFLLYYNNTFKKANPDLFENKLISDFNDDLIPIKKIIKPLLPHKAKFNEDCQNNNNTKIAEFFKETIKVKNFISESISLNCFNYPNIHVLNTTTQFNIDKYDNESIELLINNHKINDFRRINKFLISINEKLKDDGVYIGKAETNKQRKRKIKDKFSFLSSFVISIDFVINRILPKLSMFKGIYFFLTKGSNRPLSRCEILGRLYFCGFEVINLSEVDNELYFTVKKIQTPFIDKNPSYGPLFKMKRTGKDGKRIFVYKFRTMHPYAEYLQNFMVEFHGYGDNGKITDDFRVTSWGKVFRKYWLDELPQLLNLVKGDLALVGVRPLSDSFLREYPEDLKLKRQKYKPGCIPPYVALKMQEVEEYKQSEVIYLEEREEKPYFTNIKYFYLAIYNILTNKIRSQ